MLSIQIVGTRKNRFTEAVMNEAVMASNNNSRFE